MNSHRLNLLGLFVVILLIFLSAGSAASQVIEGVLIVNGRDGVGMSQSIPVGVFQVDGKQLGQNVSVKVSKDFFVQFCAQKDGSGKCEQFGEGTHNLASSEFNFIRVGRGPLPVVAPASGTAPANPAVGAPAQSKVIVPLTVFEQKNWLGRSQFFGLGMYRSFRGEFGKLNDNQARSVVVAKGFRVRFCAEEGINFRGAGDCEIYDEEGRYNLRFANSISFIEVTDLSDKADDDKMPVILYEDASQAGKMQGFDIGKFFAAEGHFRKLGNDQASSISVKKGYRASVCADEPMSGDEGVNCEEFGPGDKNLKNKKAASYLRVWKDSK